jgi:tetratricopeptide (TPR) repeat protein
VAARFSAQLCDDTGGYSYLAKVLMAKGKLRQAERAVALALEPHRNPDAISWATCARLFVMLKQWDEARQAAERSLSYGRNVISLSMLAGIYIGLGDLPKAKEFLVEGRAMAPEDKILNVQYASVLINEGDYSRASDILTFLENQYPTDPWLIGLRSKICFATGDWEGAKTLAMASFKRNPTRQALTATIHAFVNLHDEIGMTEWLLRVMNSDPIRHESLDTLEIVAPFSADIYAFLVRFFLTQGKLGMAEWFAQEMYKYYRESEVRSYIFMAMVIAALNQPFRLEELTIEGLKQFSGNQALRGLYLEALRKQKRYDEVLEIGGRFTFDHISVPLCLAYSAMESKQYEQAYEFLLEAEKLVDGEAETYFDSRLRLYGCYLYIYDNMARAGLFPTTIRGLPEAVQTAVEQLRAFPREKVGRSQEHHYRSMQRIIDQYQW